MLVNDIMTAGDRDMVQNEPAVLSGLPNCLWLVLCDRIAPVSTSTVLVAAFASVLFIGSPLAVAADYYRWVDQNGVVHFTDSLHNIPETQRGKAGRIQSNEPSKSQPPPVPVPPAKASIPFEKQGQVVIVEATLNKKASAKFVVDTGASYTMISSAVAKELDIDTEQERRTAPFQTANGIIQAPLVSLDSINVGGMEIRNLTAAVHDILVDSRMGGLLGLNFLSNFRMDIDTQKGVLHLEKK
jgi:clan AA aspartic protease (TIGR02281 family)